MKNLLNPLKKILTSLTGEETEDKNIVAVVDKIADAVEDNESIDALKNLYVKFGGNEEDVENLTLIPDVIDKLSKLDIGGASVFYVAFETDFETGVVSCDKTFDEIQSARSDGAIIMPYILGSPGYMIDDGFDIFQFLRVEVYDKWLRFSVYELNSSNEITVSHWSIVSTN